LDTPSLWQEQHPGRAFPALDSDHRADVCVVGAGVTGASCAWRLLEHGVGVTVVDGRRAAAAASGRNGGFAVTGTGLDPDELDRRLGEAGARDLRAATERSLDAMIALAAELGVPQAVRRTGSLWVAQDEHERSEIEHALSAATASGIPCRAAADLIPEPMRDRCQTAAFFPRDAELLPATWVRTLAAAAADRGATLFEHSPVRGLEREGDCWLVHAGGGKVRAQAVVVACDGLIPRLLPQLDGVVYPVRGQVLATEPLQQQGPLVYPTHSQSGFMYYRPTDDGRVVVGGGRLEQLEHEYTDAEAVTAGVQDRLDAFLAEWLGLGGARVTHRWAGIMGFSADLLPVVGALPNSPGLYVAGGYSGVGNVLGHLCGGIAADLIATGSHPQAAALDAGRFDLASPVAQLEKQRSRELALRLSLAQP
jgi:glycine/D-amino acid oxidase-like deaminating enzyme